MLPSDPATSSRTIFINPNFSKVPLTHINPKFFRPQVNSSIHINPNFLAKEPHASPQSLPGAAPSQDARVQQENATVIVNPTQVPSPNKIISKSRTKIVRMPMKIAIKTPNISALPSSAAGPLIKIGLRKLIRTNAVEKPKIPDPELANRAARVKQYKVDRRTITQSTIRTRKISFTGRYALRRSSEFPVKKTVFRNTTSLSFSKTPIKSSSTSSKNRQLQLLNINGVLYKSTRNKLERKDVNKALPMNNTSAPAPKRVTGERAIFVRGTKYLLDKTGFNLTRVATKTQSPTQKSLRRIDIGGLTYVAKSKNVLVRTDTHLTRNHVSSAKHKSIQVLSKRYAKTNVSCPIFRRVGKCAAFESGKCMKVHDKMHVAICPKFLRGDCMNSSCLLSHNVSLSKMPVCKFFLQGCCVREDCPYLHKKLSAKAEICLDFLKGFCQLAQECNKRHEFVCPDVDTKGKCEKVKCSYCRKQQLKLVKITTNNLPKSVSVKNTSNDIDKTEVVEKACVSTRYFTAETVADLGEIPKVSETSDCNSSKESECDKEDTCSVPKRRPQLGDLPAFIPLS